MRFKEDPPVDDGELEGESTGEEEGTGEGEMGMVLEWF